jgi:hypothetical protein
MLSTVIEKILKGDPFFQAGAFPTMFTWKELEILLNLRPFLNPNRIHVLSQKAYKWDSPIWLTDKNSFPTSLLKQELEKYVCFIQDCSKVNKKVNDVCKAIEDATGIPLDMHIYFSLIEDVNKVNTRHGFGIHRDTIDVMIIQSEGRSRFRLWGKDIVDTDISLWPDNDMPAVPIIDEIMTPGSTVYIPRGCWHQQLSQGKRMSLSFAFASEPALNETQFEDRSWLSLS